LKQKENEVEIEKYFVEIKGTRPLLMNACNPELLKREASRRRSEIPDPEEEAKMRLYKDPKGKPCIPAYVVKACLRSAGRNYKVPQRKATYASMIRAGIQIEPEYIPLKSNGWVVDIRPVVIQGSRILRARPRFDKWGLEFYIINLDPGILKKDIVKRILIDAGKYYGIGDYRPEYGLFEIVKFEEVKE